MIRSFVCRTALAAVIAMTPHLAPAESLAGAYLAGRQAAMGNDFEASAKYFTRALARDPSNLGLMDDTVATLLAMGSVNRAVPIAQIVVERDVPSQAAHMALIVDMFAREQYDEYLALDSEDLGIGPLVDSLLRAWALVGAGQIDAAVTEFDRLSEERGLRGFAIYHKTMALALVGEFERAAALFVDGAGPLQRTRRGAMAHAEVLSQLDRNEDALASLEAAFGSSTDPELEKMIRALKAGETLPFTHVTSARDGASEVFYSVAGALRQDAGADYTLVYARMAVYLRPGNIDALLMVAELLEELENFELASAVYKVVPADDPAFHAAELGRAAALRQSGKPEAAVEVLEQLAKRFGDLPLVHSTLGDVLRQLDRFEEAIASYDRAIELAAEAQGASWFLHYARAISLERIDEWDRAEADFRRALELNPGQPQVLNYLGYSMVEMQINLDEALEMIEQAVAASPDSGYIVDSLGWVLYRLGRYEEAVPQMERAVELMAVDPVVNDHLGDVYWAVGRYREARFQWARALSFVDPEDTDGEADPDRIRRKLDVGLDVVLQEEGAPPLKLGEDI